MTTPFPAIAVAAALGLGMLSAPAQAQETLLKAAFEERKSAEIRINKAGKLRMLSQKIPAAACQLAKGIDVEATAAHLSAATAEFDQILNALEFGDTEMGIIGPETDRKTLVALEALRAQWAPFHDAAKTLAATGATDANLDITLNQNLALLDAAKALVTEVAGAHTNPGEMLQADSMAIDIAGRQRMLLQKMSKASCLMTSTYASDLSASELAETAQVFDASLEALRFGMQSVGLQPPPNAQVSAALDVVLDDWRQIRPSMNRIAAGDAPDPAEQARRFQLFNSATSHMNAAVELYSKSTDSNL